MTWLIKLGSLGEKNLVCWIEMGGHGKNRSERRTNDHLWILHQIDFDLEFWENEGRQKWLIDFT
jgi:hypothetical protein